MKNKPSNYYKTDKIFHNDFLEILEDCIEESNYKSNEKMKL